MKILHLTPTIPWPADSGGRIAVWNQLRAEARFAQVGLLSFGETTPDQEVMDHLGEICWEAEVVRRPRSLDGVVGGARSLLTQTAMNLAKYRWPVFTDALTAFISNWKPDVVVAHHLHMAPYLGEVFGPARVLREHNVDSELMFRYAESLHNPAMAAFARRQADQIRATERRLTGLVEHCQMISSDDAHLLGGIAPGLPTSVVPAAINPAEYEPAAIPSAESDPLIVIAGSMGFRPTGEGVLQFVETCWPKIRNKLPRARLRIIGSSPTTLANRLRRVSGVELTGRVDRVADWLDGANAFVVPLDVGSGIRVRILESMAWSIPIVSTTIGCEGIDVENGRHLLIADGPDEMSAAVLKLVREPVVAQTLRREGRRLIERKYSLDAVELLTSRLYRRLAPQANMDVANG